TPFGAVETVAEGSRVDERCLTRRVERGNVATDAAVGDPESRREVGGGRPAAVLGERIRELLVPFDHARSFEAVAPSQANPRMPWAAFEGISGGAEGARLAGPPGARHTGLARREREP